MYNRRLVDSKSHPRRCKQTLSILCCPALPITAFRSIECSIAQRYYYPNSFFNRMLDCLRKPCEFAIPETCEPSIRARFVVRLGTCGSRTSQPWVKREHTKIAGPNAPPEVSLNDHYFAVHRSLANTGGKDEIMHLVTRGEYSLQLSSTMQRQLCNLLK